MDFRFKQFGVNHSHCAMKVGTDSVLLGAWATGGRRVLDIGCGCGLLSLMMAQRFPSAEVWGVEIDEAAARQADDNVRQSPFAPRINIVHARAQDFFTLRPALQGAVNAMVCNPPYYADTLPSRDKARDRARDANHLPLNDIFTIAQQGLSADGTLSLVLPADCRSAVETLTAEQGFFVRRLCLVATKEGKTPQRMLTEVGRQPADALSAVSRRLETSAPMPLFAQETLLNADGTRSQWHRQLTADFYLIDN